jgi:hypothetical protein
VDYWIIGTDGTDCTTGIEQTTFGWTKCDWDEKIIGYIIVSAKRKLVIL